MKRSHILLVVGVLAIVVIAGGFGWWLGRSSETIITPASSSVVTGNTSDSASNEDVSKIVSYSLPDGWKENSCPNAAGKILVNPKGTNLDCSANLGAPIKMYVDPQNTTDCQQLEGTPNVRKHICKSLYINGQKSLQALTEYPASVSNHADTTLSYYFVNTGDRVVVVEYQYTTSNPYQAGFDQLATSFRGK